MLMNWVELSQALQRCKELLVSKGAAAVLCALPRGGTAAPELQEGGAMGHIPQLGWEPLQTILRMPRGWKTSLVGEGFSAVGATPGGDLHLHASVCVLHSFILRD